MSSPFVLITTHGVRLPAPYVLDGFDRGVRR